MRELIDLFEARQSNNPDIEYKEVNKAGQLDKIMALLSGNTSGVWTKVAKALAEAEELADRLKEIKDEYNADIKANAPQLFNISDELLTRVIDTKQMIVTLGKKQVSTKVYHDHDAFFEELADMFDDLQIDKIKSVLDKHTKTQVTPKSPRLTTKLKATKKTESVQMNEGLGDVWSKLTGYLERKFNVFDSRMNNLKQKYI